jgi:hypothetical protein
MTFRPWHLCWALLVLAGCASSDDSDAPPPPPPEAQAQTPPPAQPQATPSAQTEPVAVEDDDDDEVDERHGVGHALLFYIPNRISDLFDVVRARLRVGPGLAFQVRATELLDLNMGGYGAVFIGIPGPRRQRVFNWPVGLESQAGIEFSVLDGTTTSKDAPHYGAVEVGLGFQAVIVGIDLGVDVWEAVDFVTGLIFIDPVEDDL